jgi:hypothetical protein
MFITIAASVAQKFSRLKQANPQPSFRFLTPFSLLAHLGVLIAHFVYQFI